MSAWTLRGFGGSGGLARAAGERSGASAVIFAAAMPVVVLVFAIAVDYSNASRFKARVKSAADAAALATSEAIAKIPRGAAGLAAEQLARQVVAATFAANAPSGAGAPTVEVAGSASAVTTSVRYEGVAPSNFGDALGYGALTVRVSATSPLLVGDASRPKIGS